MIQKTLAESIKVSQSRREMKSQDMTCHLPVKQYSQEKNQKKIEKYKTAIAGLWLWMYLETE